MMSVPPTSSDDQPRRREVLLPQHREDLHRSGLSDEQVRRCGFYSLSDPAAVAQLLRRSDPAVVAALGPCLGLPFFAPDGTPLDYVRCKPDRPRALHGKRVKYESPVGLPNRAYFPPSTRAVLNDPRVPLLITEGEKKSARADQDGFACIGLVGVYGWQKKRPDGPGGKKTGPRELIPDLAGVAWGGRRVVLAFDSDRVDKPEVRRAEWQLAEALRAVGADVRVLRLPSGPDGTKVGLDDYLVAEGADALRRLIETAIPPEPPLSDRSMNPSQAFHVGDRVTPSDRGNVGTVVAVLGGGRFRVRFEGEEGSAEKDFPAGELQPWPSSPSGRRGSPPTPLRPYAPFPVDALPDPVRPFVRAVSAAIPCDPAAVALPVLVACGAAVGAARVLAIKNSWVEPPILWGSLVARSGAVKSPPVEHAIDPLMRIDLELRRASNEAIQAHKDAVRARKEAERERKAAARKRRSADPDATTPNDDPFPEPGGDDPGDLPPKLRCVAQDITIESLALILSENPKGVLVYRDELASWFNALGRYSRTDTTADWLTLFHARTLTVDRKTGDKVTVAVPNAAASLVGTIQPKVLARTFTPEFRASGGAARLLLVMPPPRQKVWTEVDVPRDVSEAYELLIRRLRALEPHAGSSRTTPLRVPFSDEARTRWGAFVNEWGRVTFEAGEEDDDLAAAFGKLEAYAARLALVHHLVTRAGAGPIPGSEPVGRDSLEAGIVLARWFANETERVYAALVEDDRSRRLRELVERVRSHGDRVTVRDLQKSNSRKYRTAGAAEADLNALAAAGWGRWEESRPPGGGHPRREFVLGLAPDTSDTRPHGADNPPTGTFDTRPEGHPPTCEIPGEFHRVSDVSGVGREVAIDLASDDREALERPSVEPKPAARPPRRRYRNDDRPYELRG